MLKRDENTLAVMIHMGKHDEKEGEYVLSSRKP